MIIRLPNLKPSSTRREKHRDYVSKSVYDLCKEVDALLASLKPPNPETKDTLARIIVKIALIKKYQRYLRTIKL